MIYPTIFKAFGQWLWLCWQSVCFRHQRSTVQIQTSANFGTVGCIKKTKKEKRAGNGLIKKSCQSNFGSRKFWQFGPQEQLKSDPVQDFVQGNRARIYSTPRSKFVYYLCADMHLVNAAKNLIPRMLIGLNHLDRRS